MKTKPERPLLAQTKRVNRKEDMNTDIEKLERIADKLPEDLAVKKRAQELRRIHGTITQETLAKSFTV